jgi:integrase
MKRTRGEGSWERLADGRWLYRVSLGVNDEGKRTRQRFYGRTQQECRQQAEDYRHRLRAGLDPEAGLSNLADYLHDWLEGRRLELRASTLTYYRILIDQHIIPSLGKLELDALTRAHVARLLSTIMGKGLSPKTANLCKVVLGAAMQDALRDGLVQTNVVRLVRQVQEPASTVRPLTAHEIELLRDAVRGTRDEALYTLALAYGLRQGELLGLCWEDVDFERGLLNIRHTLYTREGYQGLSEPKTPQSRRAMAMPPLVVDALLAHKARQDRERDKTIGWTHHPNLVFRHSNGYPLLGRSVTRSFQTILAGLGIEKHRFHDLRHTCATFLLLSGVQLKVIQTILGHATLAITADTYAHVLPSMQEDAIGVMAGILESNGPTDGPKKVRDTARTA